MQRDEHTKIDLPFRRIIWPLAAVETIVWAAYYYAFPALLLIWESDLGWTKTELSGAFTLALVVSAVLAPFVGRLIDRGFAEQVFAYGAALGALMLVALSAVTTLWQFYLIWFGLGVAMAATLYEACFSVLTKALGDSARRAITTVALVAGFAGTVSFPSAHFLSAWLGWRSAVLVFAAAVAGIALPLIIYSCRLAAKRTLASTTPASLSLSDAMRVMRLPAFWWLALLFAAIAMNHIMLISHLLAILDTAGITQTVAVTAASMIGPMQVFGRLLMTTIGRQASTFLIFMICLTATLSAAIAIMWAGASPIFLFGFVILQGAGYGVTSIVRPIFVAEQLGRRDFGTVAGLLAIAFVGGSAVSPIAAALIWEIGGYTPVIWTALSMSVLGIVALIAVVRSTAFDDP